MMSAGFWDWLSTTLMIVGFTTLLGLGICLMLALTLGTQGTPSDDTYDERPIRVDVGRENERLRLLAG